MDLNKQYFKFKHKPTWGFGSSGLGARFNPGTTFAKQPTRKPHQRLQGFRELREAIPERSEKEYQEALENAIEGANVATAAAMAAASSPPPAASPTPVTSPAATSKRVSYTSESDRGGSKSPPLKTDAPVTQ
jgi:hypothetical protein